MWGIVVESASRRVEKSSAEKSEFHYDDFMESLSTQYMNVSRRYSNSLYTVVYLHNMTILQIPRCKY